MISLGSIALALVAGLCGLGVLLALSGLKVAPATGGSAIHVPPSLADPKRRRRVVIATLVGLAALVVTRWPMALPLGVLAVLGSQGLGGSSAKETIARLEAIAGWTEMLRDTLAGASGLTQALLAAAPISPRPLRQEMNVLASRLQSGVAMTPALIELANDLGDPAADTVVACLVMAASERAQRLSDLLTALAESTREEVAMRLQIESSRASARSAVRMITVFSFGLLALMAVFSRSYLSPYGTAGGQVVLGVIGCIYGLGLWLMTVMARPRVFPRLSIRTATMP